MKVINSLMIILAIFILSSESIIASEAIQSESMFKYKLLDELECVPADSFVIKTTNKEISQDWTEYIKFNYDASFSLFFDFSCFDLNIRNRKILKRFMTIYPKHGPLKIWGFACPIGSKNFNNKLSFMRSKSVKTIFEANGFKNLIFHGKGESFLKSEKSKEYSLNRRVEILYDSSLVKGQ